MPEKIYPESGMERHERILQISEKKKERRDLSCFPVYFCDKRLQFNMSGLLGHPKFQTGKSGPGKNQCRYKPE
jgi:hypothetical protein